MDARHVAAAAGILVVASLVACSGSASGDFPADNTDPRVGDLSGDAQARLDAARSAPGYEERLGLLVRVCA